MTLRWAAQQQCCSCTPAQHVAVAGLSYTAFSMLRLPQCCAIQRNIAPALFPALPPQYLIPMLGMLLGNACSGVAVGLSTVLDELSSGLPAVLCYACCACRACRADRQLLHGVVCSNLPCHAECRLLSLSLNPPRAGRDKVEMLLVVIAHANSSCQVLLAQLSIPPLLTQAGTRWRCCWPWGPAAWRPAGRWCSAQRAWPSPRCSTP